MTDFTTLSSILRNKTVVIGVTGSIAAYKSADIISQLSKFDITTHAILTESAQHFITPLTLQTLSKNKVITKQFDLNSDMSVEHISLAKKADVLLIAPATANIIGKLAAGICDDFLTTTAMATRAKIIVCPAMNTNMLENQVVQENIQKLKHRGFEFVESKSGVLACGDVGNGKLADVSDIVTATVHALLKNDLMKGKRVLITSGPTFEDFDPFRFISNNSSGKMGLALAKACQCAQASITFISAFDPCLSGVNFIKIRSAQDMYEAVMANLDVDFVFMAAAVSDFSPEKQPLKIKKTSEFATELHQTKDILAEVGRLKNKQVVVGFAAETNDCVQYGMDKLKRKNLDFIAVNDIGNAEIGFKSDDNEIDLIYKGGKIVKSGKMSKFDGARWLVQSVALCANGV